MSVRDRQTLVTLFFSVFTVVIGVGIVVPLLPVHAHGLGAGGLQIGALFGAFALSRTLFLPGFGRLSDRVGRKRLIVPGLLAYAAISAALAWVDSVSGLIAARFLHGVASAMLMPVIQAYVGDLAPPGREGRVLGMHGTFALIGMALGPLVGGLIHDRLGLRFAFLSMGALSLVACAACAILLPPTTSERAAPRRDPAPWREMLRDGHLSSLFGFRLGYVICIGVIWGFLPLFATIELSLASTSIGILIMLGILASGVMNVPMGMLADRANRRILVVAGGLLAACAMMAFGWSQTFRDLAVACIVFGIGGGVSMPAIMAMAARDGSRRDSMGSVMALMTVAHSLGMLIGSLVGGLVMARLELRAVFPAGAIAMSIGTAYFVAVSFVRRARDARDASIPEASLGIDPVSVRR